MEQELYPRVISENHVVLPKWLYDLIFNELGAIYHPMNSDMTNIDDNKEKTLNYLGTYFPRSYAEAFCIFSKFFKENNPSFLQKEELSIFDFGCGTGGEIMGLLTVLERFWPNLKKVKVVGLDGNKFAIKQLEAIINRYSSFSRISIDCIPRNIPIDDGFDLSVIDEITYPEFDIIMSFKAICEFVTKSIFVENAYRVFLQTFTRKLRDNDSILLIEDITTRNGTSEEWLPIMLDNALKSVECKIVDRNNNYNQEYYITHSRRQNVSKVAWRMLTL